MVLMNLFAGHQWRRRHREQTSERRGEGEDGMNGESILFSSEVKWTLAHLMMVGFCVLRDPRLAAICGRDFIV